METYIIHNVPYYYEPTTNKLYIYNDTKLHIGSYDPSTQDVIYRDDIPHANLAEQLKSWRETVNSNDRKAPTDNVFGSSAGGRSKKNTQ